MVPFQDLLGPLQVQVVLGAGVPGEVDDPVQVGADDAGLGGVGVHAGEAVELPLRFLAHHGGKVQGLKLSAELLHLLLPLLPVELPLDGLHLLPEEVLPLVAVNLLLDLLLDAPLGLNEGELRLQEHQNRPQALGHVRRLQDLLLVLEAEVHVEGDVVGELRGVLQVQDELGHLRGQVLPLLEEGLELVLDLPDQGLDQNGLPGLVGEDLAAGLEVVPQVQPLLHPDPGEGLHQDLDGAVRVLAHLQDVAGGAHLKEVRGPGGLHLLVLLAHDEKDPVAGQGLVNGPDGDGPPGVYGHHHGGVDDRAPHRADGHGFR